MTMSVEEVRARLLDDMDHDPRWEYVSTLLNELDAERAWARRAYEALNEASGQHPGFDAILRAYSGSDLSPSRSTHRGDE